MHLGMPTEKVVVVWMLTAVSAEMSWATFRMLLAVLACMAPTGPLS